MCCVAGTCNLKLDTGRYCWKAWILFCFSPILYFPFGIMAPTFNETTIMHSWLLWVDFPVLQLPLLRVPWVSVWEWRFWINLFSNQRAPKSCLIVMNWKILVIQKVQITKNWEQALASFMVCPPWLTWLLLSGLLCMELACRRRWSDLSSSY